MCTTAVTYHESYGLPPRQFAVTFELRGQRRVRVICEGKQRVFEFHGRGYRPHSKEDRHSVIELFLKWERAHHATYREASMRCRPRRDEQRQLPLGDRT